jgi:uncharacterized protein YxeA
MWKTKRIVIILVLVLLISVGVFFLSKNPPQSNLSIDDILKESEQIEEVNFVDDDTSYTSDVDTNTYDELDTIQDEI